MPLRVWTYIGLAFAALSFIYGAFIVTRTLLFGNPVHGYASLISVMLFVGGIQLIGIGVIGEYLGRIYHESKQRPVYLVRRRYRADALVGQHPARHAAQPDAAKLLPFPVRRVAAARRRQPAVASAAVARNLSVK